MSRRRIAALLAVNVIVFCIGAELLALAIYYFQTGHLFYLHRRTYTAMPGTPDRRLTGDGLHPYFGPTHKAGYPFDVPEDLRRAGSPPPRRAATNNFGFVSSYDYPFIKERDDQFIVGIFGGSVGVWFCEVGATRLMENLKGNSFFTNRELVPLCLSHEGYKQPQQVQVLTYFLSVGQQFDLIINIDGFNEVALSSLNDQQGTDISMPSPMHLNPLINLINQATLTPDKLQSLAALGRDKQRLNDLADAMQRNRIAAINFGLEQYQRRVSDRYRAELATFTALPSIPSEHSLIHATPSVRPRDERTLFEDIARNWVTSSMLMNDVLAARHIAYFHFLQPNQYHRTARVFNPQEAATALNARSPFKEGIEKGYPVLLAMSHAGALKRTVRFFDAVHIFDTEPAPVYIDDCCHYTLRGNDILADFIASSILRSTGAWTRGSPAGRGPATPTPAGR